MKINLNRTLLKLTMFLCAVALVGCTNTAKPVSTTETNKGSVSVEKKDKYPDSPTNRDTPNITASNIEKIGVPECDDYIEKYEACITGKVPEAARAAMKSSFEQTRKTWKDLASNPQTKNSLASMCKQSKDVAKQSMEAFKCDW
jgi:hypothetical protein